MKKAFTLVEVLVSVVLLGLISMFISSTIAQTKSNNKLFENRLKDDKKLESLIDILYDDIYFSKSITVDGLKKYSLLHVKSKNSIYGIDEPYVVWLVLKDGNRLIRMESARKIVLPLKEEMKKWIFIDEGIKNCEHFTVNISKDEQKVLTYMKTKDKKPIIFEIEKL
jgi:prepilin-type N-terminal cleavage/methylation domain-containing protein